MLDLNEKMEKNALEVVCFNFLFSKESGHALARLRIPDHSAIEQPADRL